MKKGQGISINVIVIAAIALLVLVVLAIVFLGQTGTFTKGVNDCENKGGSCTIGACPQGTTEFTSNRCADTTAGAKQTCCIQVQ